MIGCVRALSSPPWSGYRSVLFALASSISSGGLIYSLMTAPSDLGRATIALFSALVVGVALAYLSRAEVEVGDGEVVVRGPLYSRRYGLGDVVEFVDIGSIEDYDTLVRIPGLTLTTVLSLAVATAVFSWGYSSALPILLALPAALLSGICFLSLEMSILLSPSLGIRRRSGGKLILATSAALIVMGALLVTSPGGASENAAFAAGSMVGLGIGGALEGLIGPSPWGWVFKLAWDEETIYVLAYDEAAARRFKEELLRAMRDA